MSPLITPRFKRRRPFALVAAASGILCLAVIGCWVFSLFAPFGQAWDTSWGGNGDGYQMRVWVAERGSLHLLRHDEDRTPIVPSTPQRIYHWGYDPPGRLALQVGPTRLGFAFRNKVTVWKDPFGRRTQTVQDTNSQVSIPLWLPMLLFALPPAAWLLARRRGRGQQLRGLCTGCGYDLRATPERCPECGAVPTKGAA